MFNFAFIMNSGGLSPETYSGIYENDEFKIRVAAVNSLKGAKELAKEYAKDGVELIDICGDFDASDANKIAAMSGLEICYAKYAPEENIKMDALEDMSEYGIIVMAQGLSPGQVEKIDLLSDEFNSRIRIVGSDESAIEESVRLADEGISFIELCSYFDVKKAKDISEAMGGRVPVGYCG